MPNDYDWKYVAPERVDLSADAGAITVPLTVGMRRRLDRLVQFGIWGQTIEEIAERFICTKLAEMEGFK